MNAGHPSIASSDRILRRRAPRTWMHGGMKTGPLRWRALFLAVVVLLPAAAQGEQTAREVLKEQRDHRLWKEVGRCDGAERYLKAFPEGLHAGEAQEGCNSETDPHAARLQGNGMTLSGIVTSRR